MVTIIFWFTVVCVVIFLYRKHKKVKLVEHHVPVIEKKNIVGYKKKFRIMNSSESALFFELRRQLPQTYYVFPNIRIADVVDVVNGQGFYKRRYKVLPRHVDFVVCDQDFKPIVVIELNGGYHNRLDQQGKDKEKKAIFEEAQLPLVVLSVGESFVDAVKKIIEDNIHPVVLEKPATTLAEGLAQADGPRRAAGQQAGTRASPKSGFRLPTRI